MGHKEHTLAKISEDWPLWKPAPKAATHLDAQRIFADNRLVMRWYAQRPCSFNVIYKSDYLLSSWPRILGLIGLRRRFPTVQKVMLMQSVVLRRGAA